MKENLWRFTDNFGTFESECANQTKGLYFPLANEAIMSSVSPDLHGDKENGAFFNHMVVIFAYALYKRGFAQEGWQVLSSIYNMAGNTARSKIYPCIPEYFNLEGRGMYSYLTGSASWFVLTMLTESFGLKGQDGNLLIEPKLDAEQFRYVTSIRINRIFADRFLQVNFINHKKLSFGKYSIVKAILNSCSLPSQEPQRIIIKREAIVDLPSNRPHRLDIILG